MSTSGQTNDIVESKSFENKFASLKQGNSNKGESEITPERGN